MTVIPAFSPSALSGTAALSAQKKPARPFVSIKKAHFGSNPFDMPPNNPTPPEKTSIFGKLAPLERIKNGFGAVIHALNPKGGLGRFAKDNLVSIGLSLALSFFLPPFGVISLLAAPLLLTAIPAMILGIHFFHGLVAPLQSQQPPPDQFYGGMF